MPAQTVIRLRRGTATQWSSTNPILSAGEIGIETNTRKFKFGNGTAPWNSLDYAVGSVATEGITIAWEDVTGKPLTFPPSAHTHTKSDITDFAHTHTVSEITDYDRTAGTVLSDTAPASPVAGLRWIKTTTMQEYIRYGSVWVEV